MNTWTAFDWAGVASMLTVAGGAVNWLLGRANGREASLNQREKEYRVGIESQLSELKGRLDKVEKSNGLLLGIVHVWIDEIPHSSDSLPAIAAQLKLAFPKAEDLPADLINLVARLDAKQLKAARQ